MGFISGRGFGLQFRNNGFTAPPTFFSLFGTPAAAYSLRSLDGTDGNVIEARRSIADTGDLTATANFTPTQILNGELAAWCNNANADATLPADFGSGAAAAYSLRYVSSSYSGNVVEVRRSSDDAVSNFTPSQILDGSLVSWVTENDLIYTSDFSEGTDGLTGVRATIAGNIDGIDGRDDNLSIVPNTDSGTHYAQIPTNTISSGDKCRVTFDYFIPSTNVLVDGVRTLKSGGSNPISSVLDEWTTYDTGEFVSGSNFLWFQAADGGTVVFSGNDTDVIYIRNIQITVFSNGTVRTLYDQRGGNNAQQTTASAQPKIVDAGVLVEENGLPAMLFDGVDDYLQTASGLSLTNPTTSVIVSRKLSGSGGWTGLNNGNAAGGATIGQTTGYVWYQQGPLFSPTFGDNNQGLIFAKSSTIGTDWAVHYNGANVTNGGEDIGTTTPDQITLGARGNGTSFSNCNIQEYFVYNSDQSTNREAIEANTNNYYSIYTKTTQGFVRTWYDQASTNDAVQTTASNQPLIVDAGAVILENGLPAVQHDGNQFTPFADLNIGQTHSIFTANRFTARDREIIGKNTSPVQYGVFESASNTFSRLDSNFEAFGAAITLNQQVLSLMRTPTALSLYENSAQVGTTQTPNGGDGIVNNLQGESSVYYIIGTMQEVLIYTEDKSANRTAMENNINDHYTIY